MFDKMFEYKYRDTKFYCHNLGGFDAIFLLNCLVGQKKYDVNIIARNGNVSRLGVSKKVESKYGLTSKVKVSIMDSYAVLTESSKYLSNSYEVDITKGDFPYEFAKPRNLFYRGNTPDITYYNDIDAKCYQSLFVDN